MSAHHNRTHVQLIDRELERRQGGYGRGKRQQLETDRIIVESGVFHGVTTGAPLTIYIVIPPTKLVSHGLLLRMWLSTLLDIITERGSPPQLPTIFMIDELAQLGGLRAFKEAVTLLRGYGLRCCLFLQSHAQLRSIFPHDHESISENCGAVVTFGHTKMPMSRNMADLLGDISADALFDMTQEQVAVQKAGKATVVARRVDYLTDSVFAGRADRNPRCRPASRAERAG